MGGGMDGVVDLDIYPFLYWRTSSQRGHSIGYQVACLRCFGTKTIIIVRQNV
jgi:hypothetical protein